MRGGSAAGFAGMSALKVQSWLLPTRKDCIYVGRMSRGNPERGNERKCFSLPTAVGGLACASDQQVGGAAEGGALVGASLLAKRPAPSPGISTLGEHLLGPLLDLLLGQVFLVRGQEPQVPVGILQGP